MSGISLYKNTSILEHIAYLKTGLEQIEQWNRNDLEVIRNELTTFEILTPFASKRYLLYYISLMDNEIEVA